MPSTTILFDLIGRDGASKAFRSAAASADVAGARMASVGKKINSVGVSMTRGITLPAALLGGVAVKMATDFDSAMTRIQTQAGASAKDVKTLTAQVLDLAANSQQGPDELANSLYHLKSVGLGNVKAMSALKQASDLAAVGNANLEDTTNALAGAWRTGIRGATNFHQAVGTLNAIVGAGNMSMTDLTAAMGTGFLPAAKTFGLSLKDVGSALALFTDEGVPANVAATRLRMTFSLLGAPSDKAAKVLDSVGIQTDKLAHKLRDGGLVSAIGYIKDGLKGWSRVDKANIISHAFGGGRSGAAIMSMINNFDVLKLKEAQVTKGMGKFGKAVATQAKTPQAQFKLLISTLQVLAVKIGNQLLPAVLSAARGLNSFLTWFQTLNPAVKKAAAGFAIFLVALGPVLAITGRLVQGVALMVKAFVLLRDAALLTRAQLAALWVTEKVGAIATKALAAAQWVLNAALDANPIALVVIGLVALAAGLVYAYKHSETFRAIVQAAFHGVQKVASKVLGWLTSAVGNTIDFVKKHWMLIASILGGPLVAAALLVIKNWGRIKQAFSSAISAVLGFIRSHWGLIVSIVGGPLGAVVVQVIKHWSAIKTATSHAINSVVGFFNKLPGRILGAVGDLGSLLSSAGKAVVQGLIDGIGSMVKPLTDKLHSITSLIPLHKGPIEKDRQLLRPAGRAIMDGLMAGIADRQMPLQTALGKITSLIQSVGDKISSLMSTRKGFMGTFTSDSVFGADLSQTSTDAAGNQTTTPGTLKDLLAFQKKQAFHARRFAHDVKKATKMGLSKDLIAQLQSQGESGAAQLHLLANGSPAQIRQLNALNKQTNQSLQAAGMRAGNYVRGGSINADIRTAQKQEHVLELLEHHLKDLAHSEKKGQTIVVKIGEEAIITAIHRRNARKGVKTAGL